MTTNSKYEQGYSDGFESGIRIVYEFLVQNTKEDSLELMREELECRKAIKTDEGKKC